MKKRCCIITLINVKLFEGNELLLDGNYNAKYQKDEYLEYNDENNVTTIDLKNKIFIRKNEEFVFKVDFNNKKICYTLVKNNLTFDTIDNNCSIEFENNIIINYELDGIRKIIINFK